MDVIIEKMKNGWDVIVVDNLIKMCQEKSGFKNCEECGYGVEDRCYNFLCLVELIKQYNEKYNTNYGIISYDKIY